MIYESTLKQDTNKLSLKPALKASPGIFSLISIFLVLSVILGAVIILNYLIENGLKGYYIEAINSLSLIYSISAFVFVTCVFTTALAIIIPRTIKNELFSNKEETKYLVMYFISSIALSGYLYYYDGKIHHSYTTPFLCVLLAFLTTFITKKNSPPHQTVQDQISKKASFIQITFATSISFFILLFIISMITAGDLREKNINTLSVTLVFLATFFLAKCAVIKSKRNKDIEIGIIAFLVITANYLNSDVPSFMTKGLIKQTNGFYLEVDSSLLKNTSLNEENTKSIKLKNPDIYLRTSDKYIVKIESSYIAIPRSKILSEGIELQ